jgi:hypothetical protein
MVKLPEFLQLKPVWRNTTVRLRGPITATSE